MTTTRSTHRPLTARKAPSLAPSPATSLSIPGFLAEITDLVRNLIRALADPYRPELHYMRGPGPKWHAKHAPTVAPSAASLGAIPMLALVPVRVRR
jgi:hypothetical protein